MYLMPEDLKIHKYYFEQYNSPRNTKFQKKQSKELSPIYVKHWESFVKDLKPKDQLR